MTSFLKYSRRAIGLAMVGTGFGIGVSSYRNIRDMMPKKVRENDKLHLTYFAVGVAQSLHNGISGGLLFPLIWYQLITDREKQKADTKSITNPYYAKKVVIQGYGEQYLKDFDENAFKRVIGTDHPFGHMAITTIYGGDDDDDKGKK